MMIKSLSIITQDAREIIQTLGATVEKLKDKTVLITGANGVVGSYFVDTISVLNDEYFRTKRIRCICVTRHKVTKKSRLGHLLGREDIVFITGDITKFLRTSYSPDYIIHSASYASPKKYFSKPIETMEANSVGTKRLLDLAFKSSTISIMFISSNAVYGDALPNESPFTEEDSGHVSPLDVRAVYSESKRFGETLCVVYAKIFGVHATIARLSNMYGPGFKLSDGRAIPDFFNQAFNTNKIEINGNPRATRAYLYIADAISGMFFILLSGRKGEAYNVASEKSFSMRDIAIKISNFFPGCLAIIKEDTKKNYLAGSVQNTIVSAKKLRKEFGWKPKVRLEKGLEKLFMWYNFEKKNESK